jgi:hypothetical protein
MKRFARPSAQAALLTLVGACAAVTATDPAEVILGRWLGHNERAAGTTLEFRANGEATWMLADTFQVSYRHAVLGSRHHLDLSLAAGPLAGRTLYCLGQMPSEDVLRLDCEPGTDPSVRPATIDEAQVQTFRRVD